MSSGNPYLRANSLPELLAWDDVDFVRCAYVTVLGRQPDPEGETYYTGRIRRGHSKMEILWQLRRSAEGPNHDPGIAGFDRALGRAKSERSRLSGLLVRAFTGGEGDSAAWRHRRALMNEIKCMRTELAVGLVERVAGVSTEASGESISEAGNAGDAAADFTDFGHLNRGTQRIIHRLLAV
jgi:hypothetical protein